MTEIDGRLPAIQRSLADAQATMRDRVGLDRERHGIRRELDRDLSSRASSIADDPPSHVIERLGRAPSAGPIAPCGMRRRRDSTSTPLPST